LAAIWISEDIESVFFYLRQAAAETLRFISQTPVLEVSWFVIVPKSWRPFADHVRRSVAGSGELLACRGRRQFFDRSTRH
jgi:hypothetical protein